MPNYDDTRQEIENILDKYGRAVRLDVRCGMNAAACQTQRDFRAAHDAEAVAEESKDLAIEHILQLIKQEVQLQRIHGKVKGP